MSRASDLEALLDELLATLADDFGIRHAMVLMLDASGERLYAVASRGYALRASARGRRRQGVIGVAAAERTPIRIRHMTADYAYVRAMRESCQERRDGGSSREIPLPGLADPRSQLAVPIGPRAAARRAVRRKPRGSALRL